MHDRDCDDIEVFRSEVHTERESLHQCTASISMDEGKRERLLGNSLKHRKRLVQKLMTEASALLLVP